MSSNMRIHSWPCSYYLDLEKQWVPGKLTLTPQSLKFTVDQTEEVLVGLPLSSITEIKKETSLFIFGAITILEKGQTKHWFSSLQPNRNVVFNIIEHFWRELLLSQAVASPDTSPTVVGQELIGLMECSQRRMEDTAKVLQDQTDQLDSVLKGLEKMESDLDVADRLLTELETPSWWPFNSKFWKMPAEIKSKEGLCIATNKPLEREGSVITVPAVVSEKTEAQSKLGKFTVLASALEIYDSGSSLLHRFENDDVDDITIHSPYEITVRQRFIGKPDVAYQLISVKMPEVIPILEVQFSKKLDLTEDALVFRNKVEPPPKESDCSILPAASRPGEELPTGGKDDDYLQLQKEWPILSEEEARELSQILSKLKELSMETEAELEHQDETLDGIDKAVDRATLTVDKHNRRMKKLK
ncbi:synaptosomal-associated protein 47 [Apodemus sylvaticus]|uniref:synaptosomal-associated protein 47 n=1 Tax=Apodemus sylvaticus TaxID=10129 RepID=UPI002242260C|nr:synaptosomal-associated protein 47 [Apodemus sylvaticus]XP_052050102.1 synaptosomal-associated protein 47 [Apodemus sylvaticus]XP_052050103.1 synaptosomal-associated protein 47 [Apodemus sylvaticus]